MYFTHIIIWKDINEFIQCVRLKWFFILTWHCLSRKIRKRLKSTCRWQPICLQTYENSSHVLEMFSITFIYLSIYLICLNAKNTAEYFPYSEGIRYHLSGFSTKNFRFSPRWILTIFSFEKENNFLDGPQLIELSRLTLTRTQFIDERCHCENCH